MTSQAITISVADPLTGAVNTYLAGRSANTRTAYQKRLDRFMGWRASQSPAPFVAQLKDYIGALQTEGLAPRSIQAHVSTIKGLLKTAAALDATGQLAAALPALYLAKAPAVRGEIQGDRLTSQQRQVLIDLPGTDTHKGRRDTALLALLAICGLRRSEVCGMNWSHIAELDGHKVIRNLSGKHGRVRTIKLPTALWRLITDWGEIARLDMSPESPVFVAVGKANKVKHGQRLTPNAIAWLVGDYVGRLKIDGISPHDLRRTSAKLARRNGASIEQVQIMLGHASPQTTSHYIGETLNLDDHAVDFSDVKLPRLKQSELFEAAQV